MNKLASKLMLPAVLLLLTVLLQGCATPSTPSVVVSGPQRPKPPDGLMQPPPPDDWLGNAQADDSKWQQQLTNSEPR